MKVVIDTHVLFWVLTQNLTRLTDIALKILKEAEEIIIPTIVLLELLGLLQKKKALGLFDILLNQILNSKYVTLPMDITIIKVTRRIRSKLELHDKVIVASAQSLGLYIVTKDEEISKRYKKTIW